jgi:hypothetical protein
MILKSAPFSWYENPRHKAERLRIQAGVPARKFRRARAQPRAAQMSFQERLELQRRDER